jgi:hypothetical protein
MKKYTVSLFVLAGSLAIAPAAFGDVDFTFAYTGPEESATGTLTGSEIGSTGDYQITSAAITVTGSAFSGTGTLDTNVSDLAAYGADNEIYPSQNAVDRSGYDLYLDLGGLLFTTGSDVYNLWGGDNNGYSSDNDSYSLSGRNGNYIDYPGTLTLVAAAATPDGGTTLALLGLAVAGLAGLRRKLNV